MTVDMQQVVILDFKDSKVTLTAKLTTQDLDEFMNEWAEATGASLSDCEWMAADEIKVEW